MGLSSKFPRPLTILRIGNCEIAKADPGINNIVFKEIFDAIQSRSKTIRNSSALKKLIYQKTLLSELNK